MRLWPEVGGVQVSTGPRGRALPATGRCSWCAGSIARNQASGSRSKDFCALKGWNPASKSRLSRNLAKLLLIYVRGERQGEKAASSRALHL